MIPFGMCIATLSTAYLPAANRRGGLRGGPAYFRAWPLLPIICNKRCPAVESAV